MNDVLWFNFILTMYYGVISALFSPYEMFFFSSDLCSEFEWDNHSPDEEFGFITKVKNNLLQVWFRLYLLIYKTNQTYPYKTSQDYKTLPLVHFIGCGGVKLFLVKHPSKFYHKLSCVVMSKKRFLIFVTI